MYSRVFMGKSEAGCVISSTEQNLYIECDMVCFTDYLASNIAHSVLSTDGFRSFARGERQMSRS